MRSIFISHNAEADGDAARRLRSDLLTQLPDAVVHLSSQTEAGPAGGSSWQSWIGRTLRNCDVVVFIVSEGSLSPWCSAELGMARLLRKPIVPLHTGSTEHISPLVDAAHAVPLDQPVDALVRIIEARVGPASDTVRIGPDFVPFPGLNPLSDGEPLFGRADERDRVLGDLLALDPEQAAIVIVSGPSGSGKSSLVRAGLLRPLRAAGWEITGPVQPKQIADDTLEPPPAATAAADRSMVIVDQAEELFDLADADRIRVETWFREIVTSGVILLIVIRIEFRNEIGTVFDGSDAPGYDLPKPIDHYIPYMDAHALDEIIRGPAKLANLDVGEALVRRLVDETATGEALPLLAYTLHLLWEDRDREHDALQASTLDALGGVGGVLVTQAREALRKASGGDPALNGPILALLSRLASPTHQPPTRAPEPIRLLDQRERDWLDEFRQVGLVSYRRTYGIDDTIEAGTQPTGNDLVDVTHEALFGWPPLRAAIDENRSQNAMLDDVRRLATRWGDGDDKDPMLLSGDNLRFALGHGLTNSTDPTMRKFVRASRRRDRGRRLSIAGGLVVVVLAALALTQWLRARSERDRAERAETVAESVRVATQANRAITSERDLAMLAAVAAYDIDDNPETRGALFDVLSTPSGPLRYFADGTADWTTLRMVDEQRGVVVTRSRDLATVDLATRRLDVVALSSQGLEMTHVEPAPNGRIVFSGRRPPSEWTVGVTSPEPGTDATIAHPVEVTVIAPHIDGVLFGDVDGGVYFVPTTSNGATLGAPMLIDRHAGEITDVDTTADGAWIASSSKRGVRVQQRASAEWGQAVDLHQVDPGARAAENVAFRRDGSDDLFAAGGDPTIRRWSLVDGAFAERSSPGRHPGVVEVLTAAPDGPILYSAGLDGDIRRWDSELGAPLGDSLRAHRDDVLAISTVGGSRLISADTDTAILWDLAAERTVERPDSFDPSWASERFIALVNGDGPLAALTIGDSILVDGGAPILAPAGGRKAWWVEGNGLVVETGDREQIHTAPVALWFVTDEGFTELGSGRAAAVGDCLAALATDRSVSFVDVGRCGDEPAPFPLTGGIASEIALSPDEDRLLVVDSDNRIRVHLVEDGSLLRSFEPPHSIVATSAVWSSNGDVIVGYDRGEQVRVIRPGDGDAAVNLTGHSDAVWWLSVDATGEELFSAGHDGLIVHTMLAGPVQVGDPLVGAARRQLNDNAAAVRGLRLISDDEVLMAIHGFRLAAWELDPEHLVRRACEASNRRLDRDELVNLGLPPETRPCEAITDVEQ